MCGIAGKVDLVRTVDRALVQQMCETLEHRGPDSRGIHASEGVGLGVQRLAVIDLVNGDQPIYNEDRSVVVVLNGEIYNHVELRDDLRARGHRFETETDTETIVHLYEDHGAGCVDHLRGMFAFAIWDRRRRALLLARDRLGKKPLFFRATETAVWFASEPRAILVDPDVPREPDFEAIDAYLRYQYVPHPRCAFKGICKLPPAHLLRWSSGEPDISRYWRLCYEPKHQCTAQDAAELVRESLLEATRLRLRSDVPVGAFLSGGVDSSAVVAAMARTGTGRVKTFSIGFDVADYDETSYARQVAERYDTDHHEFRVEADAINVLPRLVWHYGEPFADSSALPTFYLADATRRHVTVALNGDGGDEVFAGYSRYAAQRLAGRITGSQRLREQMASFAGRVGAGAGGPHSQRRSAVRVLTALGLEPAARYDTWVSYFTRTQLDDLYEPAFRSQLAPRSSVDSMISEAWEDACASDPVEIMLDVDVNTYLPGDLLVKMDIAGMAHSLEIRSPFLDHVLMERVAHLPAGLKLRGVRLKTLLKEAMRPWLPGDVLSRRKMGFAVPIASWFRGSLAHLPKEILLDPRAVNRGVFRPDGISRLVADHRAGNRDNASKLWALIQLELWFRTYVDSFQPTPQTLVAG